jgi:hypothetical protein
MKNAPRQVPLVAIVGSGRSGSTLLEQMLGSLPGYAALGEVNMVYSMVYLYKDKYRCGCGASTLECPVWNGAVREGGGSRLENALARMHAARKAIEKRGRAGLRRSAWLGRCGLPGPVADYQKAYAALYRELAKAVPDTTFIDSSKNPRHAFLLAGSRGFCSRFIHLVRDPRAVAYSWTRLRLRSDVLGQQKAMLQQEAARTARQWLATNRWIEDWRKHHSLPLLRIRYEELVRQPAGVLRQLAEFLEEPRIGRILDGPSRVRVGNGHSLRGNPARSADGTVELKYDRDWETGLSGGQKKEIEAIARPLLEAYGFLEHA